MYMNSAATFTSSSRIFSTYVRYCAVIFAIGMSQISMSCFRIRSSSRSSGPSYTSLTATAKGKSFSSSFCGLFEAAWAGALFCCNRGIDLSGWGNVFTNFDNCELVQRLQVGPELSYGYRVFAGYSQEKLILVTQYQHYYFLVIAFE